MLILTCILLLKFYWKKYKWLSVVLVIIIICLLIIWIRSIYLFLETRKLNKNTEWININDFSSSLKMDKEWKLQSYPKITLLSDVNWEILTLNANIWDIVEEYQILMQIKNINSINSDYDDVWVMIETMYENYEEIEKQYNEFQKENGDKIKKLEKKLFNDQNALVQAIEFRDSESKEILEDEIEKTSKEYNTLKQQQDAMKNKLNNLESEIKLVRNETDKFYSESEKQTPRAPFKWIIEKIYINEWESVRNWDPLITIINNNFTPEISVSLDFDEYVLTKDLTWVDILIENENWWNFECKWEIYTRSPILNNEWKYTITVKIIDEVSDLILSDENTKVTVIFTIDSTSQRIPVRCFKKIWKTNWILSLRDGDILTWREVWIKSKWEDWVNVENLALFWLEKEDEKDGIDLCIEDWNNEWYKYESVVEWRNEFETVEDFCWEFIKENPMYWTGHRNAAIVSLLWWPGENIEVLCDIE